MKPASIQSRPERCAEGESAGSLPNHLRTAGSLLLLALVLSAFFPLVSGDFIRWDDYETIAGNRSLNPVSAHALGEFWTHEVMDLYVPVTYTFWSFLAAISPRHAPDANGFTLSPAAFHIASLCLHTLAAIIVWRILAKLTRHELAALAGAALFALHPIQTEALGWISGNKDVLSGTLSLLSVWLYLSFALSPSQTSRSIALYILGTFAFVAALLAKPQAVAVPAVVLVLDLLLLGRPPLKILLTVLPWFACCIPVIYIGRQVQAPIQTFTQIWFRPIVAADAIAFYLYKLLMPIGLVVDYSRSPAWLIASPQRFWTWLIPTILFVIGLLIYRQARWPLASLLVFAAALSPVLGFLRFDYQAYSTVADHYLYVAMLGPAMALAFVLAMIPWQKWLLYACLLLAVSGALSFKQARFWHDTLTLFQHTYDINPHSLAAAGELGVQLASDGDMQDALPLLAQSVREHPELPFAHYTYANILLQANHPQEALPEFDIATRGDPTNPRYLTNFGVALARSGRPMDALARFEQAAKIDPNDPDNFQNAGITLLNMGQPALARPYLIKALQLDPKRQAIAEFLRASPATQNSPSAK